MAIVRSKVGGLRSRSLLISKMLMVVSGLVIVTRAVFARRGYSLLIASSHSELLLKIPHKATALMVMLIVLLESTLPR